MHTISKILKLISILWYGISKKFQPLPEGRPLGLKIEQEFCNSEPKAIFLAMFLLSGRIWASEIVDPSLIAYWPLNEGKGDVAYDSGEVNLQDVLPERIGDGLKRISVVLSYMPENLYQYINGGAENYLSYEFCQVVTTDYDYGKGEKSRLVVDIYQMRGPEYAFGIYSSERPPHPRRLNIGVEGYQEGGVLNFCKGDCYVKIVGFETGEIPDLKLRKLAEVIAQRLKGTTDLPALFKLFPQTQRVKGSERFMAKNVMGQEFLSNGYFVNYTLKDGFLSTAFLFETEKPAKAKGTYIKFKSNLRSDQSGLLLVVCKDSYLFGVRRPPDLKEGTDFIKRWSESIR